MSFFHHFSSFRRLTMALSMVLAVMCFVAWGERVSAADVETYVDQAVPDANGIPVNHPLRAGDMTLPKIVKDKTDASTQRPTPPRLPIGSLSAPQIAPHPPTVQSSASAPSSANAMLMHGLRQSLQKAGVNPNLPESNLTATSIGQQPETTLSTTVTATPVAQVAPEVPVAKATTDNVQYQPGREPRSLAAQASPKAAASYVEEDRTTDVEPVAEPQVAAPAAAVVAPVAAPVASAAPVAAPAPTPARRSLFSIFGSSVEEEEQKTVAAPAAPVASAAKTCEESVTPWSKSCGDAGYPAGYTGKLTGETRISCPSGEAQDVWLSNSCELPSSNGATKAVAESDAQVQVDANCGAANGKSAEKAPDANLCIVGEASDVSGSGPWLWSCKGLNGGMIVSCAAPKVATAVVAPKASAPATAQFRAMEDGKCGTADGVGADDAPAAGLCTKGIASSVNGSGPWTWACSGINGGQANSCTAPRKVDGICGTSSGKTSDEMPRKDLCVAGLASAVNGNGPWTWTCAGLHGGAAASCSVAQKVNAVCGAASLSGHHDAPSDSLCNVGDSSPVRGSGPWSWTCSGTNGGAAVSCSASLSEDGMCGSTNGKAVSRTPDDDLCEKGAATRVTGSGPWMWNCGGTNGGNTTSCTASVAEAPMASPVTVETPVAQSVSSPSDEMPAPAAAPRAAATPSSILSATSPEAAIENMASAVGTTHKAPVARSAPAKVAAPMPVAACGAASDQAFVVTPSSDLCAEGKPSAVTGRGPWAWTCTYGKGKAVSKANCSATIRTDGACGVANGSILTAAPAAQLCASGTSTAVAGSGPWVWSCVGSGGGSSISCSANAQQYTRVDGTCGAASNASMTSAPVTNLCDSGKASSVNGEGPWTWTCSGMNGGIASVCTTNRIVPKAPEPPAPPVDANCGSSNGVAMNQTPASGLCSSGTSTAVSGHGPWNWNCLGSNGGMSVSCTAPLMPPSPISGVCGAANGVSTGAAPRSGLCASGISSAVSGQGPWTWSCSGVNGGGAVSCVAPITGNGGGALPSAVTPSDVPTPRGGLVTPRLQPSAAAVPAAKVKTSSAPQTLTLPTRPAVSATPANFADADKAPSAAPDLPSNNEELTPPSLRDGLVAAPTGEDGQATPNKRLVLPGNLSIIHFAHGSEQLDQTTVWTLDRLAEMLAASPGSRITLVSGADNTNISPRDARRLSLNRALALRDYLSDHGIPSSRVDVRALGANITGKDMDRVDVNVN